MISNMRGCGRATIVRARKAASPSMLSQRSPRPHRLPCTPSPARTHSSQRRHPARLSVSPAAAAQPASESGLSWV